MKIIRIGKWRIPAENINYWEIIDSTTQNVYLKSGAVVHVEYSLCKCPAYPYPHPEGIGDCRLPDSCDHYGNGCFTCEAHDTCWLLPDGDYDPRGEALTAQERNPDFRSWL